ncbi:recombinase family protein [Streptomyces shenzhenensis]|uniref:recombinase family protein n=1 Tax=Streptomyces shenzhenensis TaxID=943815 RepID=UPI001F28CE34|nr:recombinase family protein [Streptomyces shenzhenensis]
MRAAIYVRLSRETDETTSPERQRAACEALCEARGWEVIVVEEDIDVSGFSRGLDRPGLQRILTRLAELDVIVFFKIDRLARSTVDFAEIMRLAEHQSVALASATEPLDLTSSMGRAMAKVIAVFAELESDTTLYWIKAARLRRAARWRPGAAAAPCLRHRSGGPQPLSAQHRQGGHQDQKATRSLRAPGPADSDRASSHGSTGHDATTEWPSEPQGGPDTPWLTAADRSSPTHRARIGHAPISRLRKLWGVRGALRVS